MAKKKAQRAPAAVESESTELDVSKMPVEIEGKTYFLCFSFGELAEAESFFRRQGHPVSLLLSLPELTLASVRDVFPCAARKHHPELSFEQAQALVTMNSVYPIATMIVRAWGGAGEQTAPAMAAE